MEDTVADLSRHYAGKLLLRSEIPLDDITFDKLLTTKDFQTIPSFTKKRFTVQCQRCGNDKSELLGTIPCCSCGQTHYYCRSCIQMGRVMACQPLYLWTGTQPQWPEQENTCQWQGELTSVQQTAADRIVQAIQTREHELLVWAVCGAGKTEMLFAGITKAIEAGKRVCLATPRADVVRELLPRFQQAFPMTSIVALYGGSETNHITAQFTLATTHQLIRYQDAFDLLIIDEIDAFPYHADPSLPFVTNRSVNQTATKIYLTATPRQALKKRSDRGELATIFVPVRYHGQPLPVPQLKLIHRFVDKEFPAAFWRWYDKRKNPTRQLLIFVATIAQADQLITPLQAKLPNKQISSVHASDPLRMEKVVQFRAKHIDILLTTTILERGVTFPSVDVVIIDAGHDVFDQAALVQIAGRAGRSPDDPTGEVWFFHDGKTEAMLEAVKAIRKMNKLAKERNK